MHTEKREDPLVELGYETRDINYSILGKVAFWFFTFGLGCFAAVGIWFYLVNPQIASKLDPSKPLPAIQLQTDATVRVDIQQLRQQETATLGSYGKNPDNSYRIPIDKAMDLIAQRGLPTTKTSTPAVSPGNTIPQNAVGTGTPPPPSNSPLPGNPPQPLGGMPR